MRRGIGLVARLQAVPAVVLGVHGGGLVAAGHVGGRAAALERRGRHGLRFRRHRHPASLAPVRRSRRDDGTSVPILDLLRQGWDALASVPHLRLYLTLGWALYLLLLGGWIILQKREPVATVSWLLGLALLPYVGFLIYHVFGPQRIERQRLRRARVRGELPAPSLAENDDVAERARMLRSATGLPVTTASRLRLLIDGAAKYAALVEDVARARDHIHLEYYVWDPGHGGTALRDALVERARAGVRVRLLVDAL